MCKTIIQGYKIETRKSVGFDKIGKYIYLGCDFELKASLAKIKNIKARKLEKHAQNLQSSGEVKLWDQVA